jgi:hypothetical protein
VIRIRPSEFYASLIREILDEMTEARKKNSVEVKEERERKLVLILDLSRKVKRKLLRNS